MNERGGGSAAPLLSEVSAALIITWWATSQLVSAHHRERERGGEEQKKICLGSCGCLHLQSLSHCGKISAQSGFFFLLGFARQRYHPSATTQLQIAWWKFQRTLLICRVNFFLPLRYVIIHAAVVERVKRLIKQLPLFNGLTLKTPISHLTSYSIEQLF